MKHGKRFPSSRQHERRRSTRRRRTTRRRRRRSTRGGEPVQGFLQAGCCLLMQPLDPPTRKTPFPSFFTSLLFKQPADLPDHEQHHCHHCSPILPELLNRSGQQSPCKTDLTRVLSQMPKKPLLWSYFNGSALKC